MANKLTLHDLDVAINWANLFDCAPNWQLKSNWAISLKDYDLWYVWSGVGKMITSDGPIDLYPGRGVWMRPGRHYEATQDTKARIRVAAVHFDLKRAGKLLRPSAFIPPVEVFDAISPAYFETALEHVVSLHLRGAEREVANTLLKSILLEILSADVSSKTGTALQRHYQQTLNPVIALIHENPARRYTVAQLAAKTGYTADHFVRLFRNVTGHSPKEFMIRQRIERALALLKDSSHTVTQIADLLGYEDLAFFSRQFKQQTGLSPDHFRRR